jgi:hypothetical protein
MRLVSAHSGYHHSRLVYLSLRAIGCKQVMCRPCSLHSQRMTTPHPPPTLHAIETTCEHLQPLQNAQRCLQELIGQSSSVPVACPHDKAVRHGCLRQTPRLVLSFCFIRQTSLISACTAALEGAHRACYWSLQ